METIRLPQVTIEQDNGTETDSALMVLGGREPSPLWLSELAFRGEVWAVDRGIEACRRAGIIPRRLIGDCDSASAESWRWAEDNGVPAERYQSDKDLTDFQLALDIFREKNKDRVKKIFLTGAWGGRFDHLWSLILSFLNFSSPHVPFCIADEREGLVLMEGPAEAAFTFARRPKALSLLSFSDICAGVSIAGVRWPLNEVVLRLGFPYAISNRLDGGQRVRAGCESGLLGFYWVWDEA